MSAPNPAPILVWLRRDLRMSDHPALQFAAAQGIPVIPVFICDELVEIYGAAPKWRLSLGVAHFARTLTNVGSKLILRRGKALSVLRNLVRETGAQHVIWTRAYDPDAIARDTEVKAGLTEDGVKAESFTGHLLFQPWSVQTKTGGFYKVYTPFWKSVQNSDLSAPSASVKTLRSPQQWPQSDNLEDWRLGAAMNRGADIVSQYVCVGEDAARTKLTSFLEGPIDHYSAARDVPAMSGTSRLSENLTYGEISPRTVWHAGQEALRQGKAGAETFLKELVWREFAYHLTYHTPHITTTSWRVDWLDFPWRDGTQPQAQSWRRAQTGVQIVDAGLRELYVTGYMHNRVRMIAGSYLTKNLLTDWRVGLRWFEECLIDWDPASNAMGWQWIAGSGPDAAPYFRVFNPATQAEKFDKEGVYRARYLPQPDGRVEGRAAEFYAAIPKNWSVSPETYADLPDVDLKAGRQSALDAYQTHRNSRN
ncbi:MAG: deoxyribodipyrimidine photo-lyase [Pseudomonadota bacterium]